MLIGVATTVLIVDDNADFRAVARELLEAEGFAVVGEAEDAAEALTQAARLHPQIVLLDVHLPDRDGPLIAADLMCGGAAVLLTSSQSERDVRHRLGRWPFVQKERLSGDVLEAALAA